MHHACRSPCPNLYVFVYFNIQSHISILQKSKVLDFHLKQKKFLHMYTQCPAYILEDLCDLIYIFLYILIFGVAVLISKSEMAMNYKLDFKKKKMFLQN